MFGCIFRGCLEDDRGDVSGRFRAMFVEDFRGDVRRGFGDVRGIFGGGVREMFGAIFLGMFGIAQGDFVDRLGVQGSHGR